MKPQKTERRSPEQIAYDEANAAYQDAWRGDRPIREARDKAVAALLGAKQPSADVWLLDAFIVARDDLDRREARTAELLAAREYAYEVLLESRIIGSADQAGDR